MRVAVARQATSAKQWRPIKAVITPAIVKKHYGLTVPKRFENHSPITLWPSVSHPALATELAPGIDSASPGIIFVSRWTLTGKTGFTSIWVSIEPCGTTVTMRACRIFTTILKRNEVFNYVPNQSQISAHQAFPCLWVAFVGSSVALAPLGFSYQVYHDFTGHKMLLVPAIESKTWVLAGSRVVLGRAIANLHSNGWPENRHETRALKM